MDHIEMYEIKALLDNLEFKHKDIWEIGRLISYCVCQTQSTKKLKPQDIISFDWDKDSTQGEDIEISDKDIERLKEKARKIWQKQ